MGRRTCIALALLLATATSAAASAAGEAPTRSEYVARLERICRPDSAATQRAVRGTRADVRHERLRLAAKKVSQAKRIFAGTVRAISKVARPGAYRATLARWFDALKRETVALGRTASALRAEDVPRFQRVWADFIHEGNKANNVGVSFGFNYCNFRPSRFQ
jgi:DNA-binding MurR/RpiR family transcriptional regulator